MKETLLNVKHFYPSLNLTVSPPSRESPCAEPDGEILNSEHRDYESRRLHAVKHSPSCHRWSLYTGLLALHARLACDNMAPL